jgi:hypothetical protein
MDGITNDYTALYIHNKAQSNNMEDCVFYYRAKKPPADFKFGCQDFWNFHEDRFDTEFKDIWDLQPVKIDKIK